MHSTFNIGRQRAREKERDKERDKKREGGVSTKKQTEVQREREIKTCGLTNRRAVGRCESADCKWKVNDVDLLLHQQIPLGRANFL